MRLDLVDPHGKVRVGEPRRMTGGAASSTPGALTAAILDVDGVLLASRHERAWREALQGIADPGCFTTAMYQAVVAGKPRLDGARAALEVLGVPDAERLTPVYAARKQERLEQLIGEGAVAAFPDALRFVQAIRALGWRMAVASSSKNANRMMQVIRLADGGTLFDLFSANVCGRDLAHGKPDPEIFLLAATALRVDPAHCLVVEDAPAGVEAARAGGHDGAGHRQARRRGRTSGGSADLVVASLDDVALDALANGRLGRRQT